MIDDVPYVASLVARLEFEYQEAVTLSAAASAAIGDRVLSGIGRRLSRALKLGRSTEVSLDTHDRTKGSVSAKSTEESLRVIGALETTAD